MSYFQMTNVARFPSVEVAYPAIFFACLLWFTVSDPRGRSAEDDSSGWKLPGNFLGGDVFMNLVDVR